MTAATTATDTAAQPAMAVMTAALAIPRAIVAQDVGATAPVPVTLAVTGPAMQHATCMCQRANRLPLV